MSIRPFAVTITGKAGETYTSVLIGHSPHDVSEDMAFIVGHSWDDDWWRVTAVRELARDEYTAFVARQLKQTEPRKQRRPAKAK